MNRLKRASLQGLTVIELMVALSVLGILLALGVPSLLDMVHRKRVEGIAQELASDLALMKATAAVRSHVNLFVFLEIGSDDALNCYSVYVGTVGEDTECDCLQPPGKACKNPDRPDAEVKTVKFAESTGIKLLSSPRRDVYMPDGRSISWPMQIRVEGHREGVLRVDLAKGAFVRVCTPDSSMPGYPACP